MSSVVSKNYQIGADGTATNNFTIRQPATPDGTVRIANGNTGSTTDLVTLTSAGNLGLGTTAPNTKIEAYTSSSGAQALLTLQQADNTPGNSWGIDFRRTGSSSNAIRARMFAVREGNDATGLAWSYTTSGGTLTQGMYLSSDGNLGLGVTPSAWSTSAGRTALQIGGSTASYLVGNNGLLSGSNFYYNNSGSNVYVGSGAATLYQQYNGVHSWFTAPSGTAGNAISFTQAMTLSANNNLLVGTTTDGNSRLRSLQPTAATWAGTFTNSAASGNPYGVAFEFTGSSPNNVDSFFLYCSDTTTVRFNVRGNGGIANFSANNVNISDRREKTNFAPAGEYLSKICAIPVQTFNYIDQNMEEDPGLTLGVVAQDVQAVAPELVMESNWGTEEEPKMRLSIYQTDLQYALMKCIQEQQAIITALTARVEALEAAKV